MNQTDQGNAEFFARLNFGKLKFDHAQHRWLIWRGYWWETDGIESVVELAAAAVRERMALAVKIEDADKRKDEMRHCFRSESLSRLKAMIERSRSLPLIADTGEGWDEVPWLLAMRNGVIDLRNGNVVEARPEQKITKYCPIDYDPAATCPQWEKTVSGIFSGDEEAIGYLQRAAGYSATGEIGEQCLFCLFGEGANGKSTLLDALADTLAPHSYTMPFSALEFNDRSAISQDVAMLAGKRFVVASETQENVRLNEGRIKSLTGDSYITARFLYKNNFTFRPTAKYWLAFNHKPRTTDDTHGFWRRIRLISLHRQFDEGECDRTLPAKLSRERAGILNWVLAGAKKYYADGLSTPEKVVTDTNSYRRENDPLREYFEERLLRDEGAAVNNTLLWQDYVDYCQKTGNKYPLGRKTFTQRLLAKGLKQGWSHDSRIWEGIALRVEYD